MPSSPNDHEDSEYETCTLNVDVREAKDDTSHYLEFRFPPNTRFENAIHLFQALRTLVTEHFNGQFWMIKMSSRVTCSNMPLLHDPTNLRVLVDVLQPVRDPAMEVYRNGALRLYFFASRAHFYRKKIHVKPVRLGAVSGSGSKAED